MSTFSNRSISSRLSKNSFSICAIFSLLQFRGMLSLLQKQRQALATDLIMPPPFFLFFRQVSISGGNLRRLRCPQMRRLVLNSSSLGKSSRLIANLLQSLFMERRINYIIDQINIMEPTQEKSAKSLKIKVGIFFGYNGEKFLGLQYQRDTENTIENIIHKILCEHGFILKTNMDNLRRIKWSRAGRTDKKVHALCNGISASLQFDQRYIIDREKKLIDFEKATKDINAQLPFDIRIFTIKKLGKAFDMRHDACSRVYNYIAPLKLFLSQEDFKAQKVLNEMEKDEIVARLNNLVTLYLGTHNFHNFTKGYKTNDPRCDRFIMSMKAELVEEHVINKYLQQRFPEEEDRKAHRMTFIRFTLVGQSFIYHQIRKMIGLLIKICYEQLPGEETIKHAFTKERYDVYLAPGEGLYLNRMTFQSYNKRKEPELRVELNEEEENRIKRYRDYLESKILSHEINDRKFTDWLQDHDKHLNEDDSEEEKSINND